MENREVSTQTEKESNSTQTEESLDSRLDMANLCVFLIEAMTNIATVSTVTQKCKVIAEIARRYLRVEVVPMEIEQKLMLKSTSVASNKKSDEFKALRQKSKKKI